MNNFEIFFYFLCFGIIAGASFAMMWSNIQSINVEMNKPKPKPRHPEAPSFFMKEIIHRSIFLSEDECSEISDFVLNNEDKIKSMGPDHYDGTRDNSLTGRFYLFNYLNVPEINYSQTKTSKSMIWT